MADSVDIPPLSQGVGYGVVIGLGLAFALFMVGTTWALKRYRSELQTSEAFNTAGRTVKSGLVASAVVSSWTWASDYESFMSSLLTVSRRRRCSSRQVWHTGMASVGLSGKYNIMSHSDEVAHSPGTLRALQSRSFSSQRSLLSSSEGRQMLILISKPFVRVSARQHIVYSLPLAS
jgi:hypothetical protein